MKKILLSLLLLFSFSSLYARSNGKVLLKFYIGGIERLFVLDKEKSLLISERCYTGGYPNSCKAFEFLNKKIKMFKPLKSARLPSSVKNPGALICENFLAQKVYLGENKRLGENLFCRFRDGTYLDTGSLYYYWIK